MSGFLRELCGPGREDSDNSGRWRPGPGECFLVLSTKGDMTLAQRHVFIGIILIPTRAACTSLSKSSPS